MCLCGLCVCVYIWLVCGAYITDVLSRIREFSTLFLRVSCLCVCVCVSMCVYVSRLLLPLSFIIAAHFAPSTNRDLIALRGASARTVYERLHTGGVEYCRFFLSSVFTIGRAHNTYLYINIQHTHTHTLSIHH